VTADPRDSYYGQLAVYRIEDTDLRVAQIEAALQNADRWRCANDMGQAKLWKRSAFEKFSL